MFAPGPSIALICAQAMGAGLPRIAGGVAGALAGNMILMAVALGAGGFVARSAFALGLLKWGVAAYLAWLGVQMIAKGFGDLEIPLQALRGVMFREGLAVAALNPKSILFYVAFLPQFALFERGPVGVAAGFLAVTAAAALALIVYAAGADRVRVLLAGGAGAGRAISRILGAAYLGVAAWVAI